MKNKTWNKVWNDIDMKKTTKATKKTAETVLLTAEVDGVKYRLITDNITYKVQIKDGKSWCAVYDRDGYVRVGAVGTHLEHAVKALINAMEDTIDFALEAHETKAKK